jgi:hypothetical protein
MGTFQKWMVGHISQTMQEKVFPGQFLEDVKFGAGNF